MTAADVAAYRCNEIEARTLTDDIRRGVEKVHQLLVRSYEWEAWRALGYASWRDYAVDEFDMSQSRAYQLLDQARVIKAIESATADSSMLEINSRQAAELAPIVREHGPEAAAEVLAKASEQGKPTAAAIRTAAEDAGRRAKVTQTTRTTEATKVEQDVDLDTGEILADEPDSDAHEALADFIDGDPSIQDARYRANVARSVVAVIHIPKYDPERVAHLLDADAWQSLDMAMSALHQWHQKVANERKPLRLIGADR